MKNIKLILLTIIGLFIFTQGVNAASGSIYATTSSSTVVYGSTFTVTVKVSCSDALGSWQFGVSYDSSYLSIVSGTTTVADYGDGSTKTKTYTYKFKAIKSGSTTVKITGASMVSWNDDSTLFTPATKNASVTIKTQAQIEASYSKDNYLKSITVEGYEISPEFDKETTEYTLEVPEDITEINVSAKVNDSTASVSGTGTIDLTQGTNKVELVVTAQNGSTKTYTLTITVKDINPIEVTVDNGTYTLVKLASSLTAPVGYAETTVTISDTQVPAFTSEITGLTLVGLKNTDGDISLYIYDNDTYTIYNEIYGASITLYLKTADEAPENFTETILLINDEEVAAYVSDYSTDLYLVYGLNVETGDEGFYIYDVKTNSLVTYYPEMFNKLSDTSKEYLVYIIALTSTSVILLFMSLAFHSKNKKLKKLILKVTEKQTENIVNSVSPEINFEDLEQADIQLEDEKRKKKKRN